MLGMPKAFKKFSSGEISDIQWTDVSGTPTTIEGYGITDVATKTDITNLESQINILAATIPTDIDLSGTADAQTSFNKAIDNLNIIEESINILESAISKLEEIIT